MSFAVFFTWLLTAKRLCASLYARCGGALDSKNETQKAELKRNKIELCGVTKCLVIFLLWFFPLNFVSSSFTFIAYMADGCAVFERKNYKSHRREQRQHHRKGNFCAVLRDKREKKGEKETQENLIIFTHSSLTSYFSFSFFSSVSLRLSLHIFPLLFCVFQPHDLFAFRSVVMSMLQFFFSSHSASLILPHLFLWFKKLEIVFSTFFLFFLSSSFA